MALPSLFFRNLFLILIYSGSVFNANLIAQEADNLNTENFLVKKGRYFNNLTFSLDQRQAENEFQLLRDVIDQDKLFYRIVGSAGFAFKDNFTVGLSFGYGREREVITILNQDGLEETKKSIEQGFSIAPQIRNYIPVGTGRLQVIIQTELNFTFGESLQRDFIENQINKIEGNFLDIQLGVSPGAVFFFDSSWAFETRVDVVGLSFRKETSTFNGDRDNRTKVIESGVDLRLNLLRLNLGVARYF